MPKPGFKRNAKVIGGILLNDPGGQAAVKAAAEKILAQTDHPDAFIQEYQTDRFVAGVVVPADSQAKHGTATRAANQVANGA